MNLEEMSKSVGQGKAEEDFTQAYDKAHGTYSDDNVLKAKATSPKPSAETVSPIKLGGG